MGILFLASTPAEVGLAAANFDTATTAARDNNYAPSSIVVFNPETAICNIPEATGDFWFHFRMYANNVNTGGSGVPFRVYDGAGREICRMQVAGGLQVYGSTTVTGTTYTVPNGGLITVDVKLTVGASGGNIVAELYINGALVSTATAVNSGTVKGQPRQCRMEGAVNSGSTNKTLLSEIIIKNDESTIGERLSALTPNTVGFYSAWANPLSAISDTDPATALVSNAAGQRHSWTPSAYAGTGSPTGIRAVVSKIVGRKGVGSLTRIGQFLRIGSTNYDGADVVADPALPPMQEWAVNPATGLPWTTSDLSSLQVGIKSAA